MEQIAGEHQDGNPNAAAQVQQPGEKLRRDIQAQQLGQRRARTKQQGSSQRRGSGSK
jgi:hypothetical protein